MVCHGESSNDAAMVKDAGLPWPWPGLPSPRQVQAIKPTASKPPAGVPTELGRQIRAGAWGVSWERSWDLGAFMSFPTPQHTESGTVSVMKDD